MWTVTFGPSPAGPASNANEAANIKDSGTLVETDALNVGNNPTKTHCIPSSSSFYSK